MNNEITEEQVAEFLLKKRKELCLASEYGILLVCTDLIYEKVQWTSYTSASQRHLSASTVGEAMEAQLTCIKNLPKNL